MGAYHGRDLKKEGVNSVKIHIVQQGDTLEKIATQYGVALEELLRVNHLANQSDPIMPGMKMKVPVRLAPLRSRGEAKGDAHAPARPRKEMPVQREEADPQIPSTLPRTVEMETVEEELRWLERKEDEQKQTELHPKERPTRMTEEQQQKAAPPQEQAGGKGDGPLNRELPRPYTPQQSNSRPNRQQQEASRPKHKPEPSPARGVPLQRQQSFPYQPLTRQPVMAYRIPPAQPTSFGSRFAPSTLPHTPLSMPTPAPAPAPYASAVPVPLIPTQDVSALLPVPLVPVAEAAARLPVPVMAIPGVSMLLPAPVIQMPDASMMVTMPPVSLPEAATSYPSSHGAPGYPPAPQHKGSIDPSGRTRGGRLSRSDERDSFDEQSPYASTEYTYEVQPYGYHPTDSGYDSTLHSPMNPAVEPPYQPMSQLPHSDVWPSWVQDQEEADSSSYRL